LALGVTHYLPVDERHIHSKERLETALIYALGGRVAEKIVFDQLSTGAGNDLERATSIAQKMVCQWGMSEKLGPMTFGKREEQIFLGREIAQHRDYSESTAQLIDSEVKNILDKAENKAIDILTEHRKQLDKVAEALLEKEVLDGHEIDVIIGRDGTDNVPEAEPTPKIDG
jgi:cell division protease FtsH